MENILKVNSIYLATEGEGIFLGTPQVFIRLQGCQRACATCDSKETWDFAQGIELSIVEILQIVHKEAKDGAIKRVSITGGEPLESLHQNGLIALLKQLKEAGYFINLETSGLLFNQEIFASVNLISVDFKTPSCGHLPYLDVIKAVLKNNFKYQIKSVIVDRVDFISAFDAMLILKEEFAVHSIDWVLTPSFSPSEDVDTFLRRFIDILNWNQDSGGFFRVIGQQHKWVFGPDRKQV